MRTSWAFAQQATYIVLQPWAWSPFLSYAEGKCMANMKVTVGFNKKKVWARVVSM